METKMIKKSLFLLGLLISFYGCSNSEIEIGNWKSKAEEHQYVLLTAKDAQKMGEILPAPFPDSNQEHWTRVKDIGETPEKLKPRLQPYAITVVEHAFAFLEVARTNNKDSSFDDIEWGWKVTLENKSTHDIYAYGGYALSDKDGFPLSASGKEWDNNENGVLIKAGARGVVRGTGRWLVNRESRPYPPTRVVKGDYRLFLKHGLYEDILEKIPPGAPK